MLLEVGMLLYKKDGRSRVSIDRVTAKRAYHRVNDTYEEEFDREVKPDNWIIRRGSTVYNKAIYFMETTKLIKQHSRYKNECIFNSIKVKELSDEQLSQILEIVKKEKTE
jgi:hypothetical protein